MYISQLREKTPLVHCITNYVTAGRCADGLLAIGARGVMADSKGDARELCPDALVLNLGTLSELKLSAMVIAGKRANKRGVPVVLDPVGVGSSDFRRRSFDKLVKKVKITLLRTNLSELYAISDNRTSYGVDSVAQFDGAVYEKIYALAKRLDCMVAVSGKEDLLTDGTSLVSVKNGNPTLTRITGAGCTLSAICGAFLSISTSLEAVLDAHLAMAIAAERSGSTPGTLQFNLMNELYKINDLDIKECGRYEFKTVPDRTRCK